MCATVHVCVFNDMSAAGCGRPFPCSRPHQSGDQSALAIYLRLLVRHRRVSRPAGRRMRTGRFASLSRGPAPGTCLASVPGSAKRRTLSGARPAAAIPRLTFPQPGGADTRLASPAATSSRQVGKYLEISRASLARPLTRACVASICRSRSQGRCPSLRDICDALRQRRDSPKKHLPVPAHTTGCAEDSTLINRRPPGPRTACSTSAPLVGSSFIRRWPGAS